LPPESSTTLASLFSVLMLSLFRQLAASAFVSLTLAAIPRDSGLEICPM